MVGKKCWRRPTELRDVPVRTMRTLNMDTNYTLMGRVMSERVQNALLKHEKARVVQLDWRAETTEGVIPAEEGCT